MFDQFKVVDKTENSIVLEANSNGLGVRRTLALENDAPVLRFTVDVTNLGDKAREAQVRSHLELDLGPLRETSVTFTSKAGETVSPDMDTIIKGMRQGEYYRQQNTPNGEWSLAGAKGLRVTQRFDPETMDFTWLYAYPEDLGELEVELWRKKIPLEPGESVSFAYDLEITPVAE